MAEQPEKIGKYQVTRALGKGAMGMVYEGYDPVIERKVAIKTILADHLEPDQLEDSIARFKREAQAGGRLQHPGIVGVYEFGNEGALSYIVMEYVEGEELRRILARGHRYPPIEIFELMKQLLAALDYSHRQGVVHRDVKPANLMVQPGPKLKIMDFGIARLETSNLTQVGTVVGTPTHMAPEQLMGLPVDGRADLWAGGVILYELLTGAGPFTAETPAAVMHRVLEGEIRPPSVANPSVGPGFDAIVARALARKPEQRFQNAREFLLALLQSMQGKPIAPPSPGATIGGATMAGAPTGGGTMAGMTLAGATQRHARAPGIAVAPEVLSEIERTLSRHIGPLAGVLVRRSQGESTSYDQFVRALGDHIEDSKEKVAFVRKATELQARVAPGTATMPAVAPREVLSTASFAAPPKAALAPEVLATAERALASYVGPLARILIKEAAGKTGDVAELYRQLAVHIDDEEEREAFLKTLSRAP